MNFKPELLAKVLAGEKTQTRRLVKPGETCWSDEHPRSLLPESVRTAKGYLKWQAGKRYAVAPGRGKHGQGFIELIDIRHECVADITNAAARAEGFTDRDEFFKTWDAINGKNKRNVQVWVLTFKLVSEPAYKNIGR